ncbi:MAG: hypothetical protein SFV55_16935 [Haliscomenobacter sp.]|uniref:hypothetical protein n=1 Tax=Haliscomenobacter sp. TaxID=2717303 RepID=UPI0029B1B0AC|nr:hypothetical protein [Haliscomenobacter sp.]MDX2070116.1 hypothetical protein [Haliscomenobacter sp.]
MKFQHLSLLLSFVLVSVSVASAQSADEAAIKKVIEAETAAWNAGNLQAQMACWQIQPYSRALITDVDGTHYEMSAEMMKKPDPITASGATATNSNYLISVKGEMAWSSHNQVTTAKDGSKSYSHEMRMLEKFAGVWKIVGMSVHVYKP